MKLTLSAVPLALLCGGSRLEDGREVGAENVYATRGNDAHNEIAKAFETRSWPKEGYAYQAYAAVSSFLMGSIEDYAFSPEMAVAYEATGLTRVLGFDIGRNYEAHGVTDEEVAGTVDLLCVNEKKKHAALVEWGTGYDIGHKKYQLEAQAGLIAHIPGQWLGEGWVFDLALVRLEPASYELVHSATHKGLDSLKGCLSTLYTALQSPTNETPGEHCTKLYCKRVNTCGALRGANAMVLSAAGLKANDAITVANAASFRRAIQIGKKWLEAKEEELKALARKEPVILENGKRYLPVLQTRVSASAQAIEALARAKGATEAELEACKKETTFEAFREVNQASN